MPIVPLSLAKSILRVDFTADDAVLSFYLDAAEDFIARHTRRQLSQVVLTRHLRGWPRGEVTLDPPPFNSISAITYRDEAEATQTLSTSNYVVEISDAIARVRFHGDLPVLSIDNPRVSIAFNCGWAPGTMPKDLQLAIVRLAGSYYMNPEAVSMLNLAQVPFGVRAVIDAWSLPTFDTRAPE
jgi:uncharacterized phiE125 gp8 family phage protein